MKFVAAVILGLGLMLATHAARWDRWYAFDAGYRAQVDAFLAGRLALSTVPEGLEQDLVWTPGGVQQVWGLGIPAWQTPFELLGRAVGVNPFPDRVALLAWLALMFYIVLRAWWPREGEPRWKLVGPLLATALLPGLVTMLRGRLMIYEEAATYAYAAAIMLLGALVCFDRKATRGRYLALMAAAGASGLIRPTVWFYGLATALVASAIWLRQPVRHKLAIAALGGALFVAGGGVLYATNAYRFGDGSEFGHRMNIHGLPGNIVATRFPYPFEQVGALAASEELLGSLFDRPELGYPKHRVKSFFDKHLAAGQSEVVRSREYYFTTFAWGYVPILVGGLVLGALAWRRRGNHSMRVAVAWAVLGGGPLFVFYLHSPCVSSRYQMDLAPALAALLVIAWQGASAALERRRAGIVAPIAALAVWTVAVVTSTSMTRNEPTVVERAEAEDSTVARSRPVAFARSWPSAYDLDDPASLELTAIGDSFERCLDETGTRIDCGAEALPGDVALHAVRKDALWQIRSDVIIEPDTCSFDDEVCARLDGDPRLVPAGIAVPPPPLYLDGFGWNYETGRVAVATSFYVYDAQYLQLDLATTRAETLPWDQLVKVKIGRHVLQLASIASTPAGERLRFEGALDPGLAIAFIAFGDDTKLDALSTELLVKRIEWR